MQVRDPVEEAGGSVVRLLQHLHQQHLTETILWTAADEWNWVLTFRPCKQLEVSIATCTIPFLESYDHPIHWWISAILPKSGSYILKCKSGGVRTWLWASACICMQSFRPLPNKQKGPKAATASLSISFVGMSLRGLPSYMTVVWSRLFAAPGESGAKNSFWHGFIVWMTYVNQVLSHPVESYIDPDSSGKVNLPWWGPQTHDDKVTSVGTDRLASCSCTNQPTDMG